MLPTSTSVAVPIFIAITIGSIYQFLSLEYGFTSFGSSYCNFEMTIPSPEFSAVMLLSLATHLPSSSLD
jgi:hypothetical protein